MIEAVKGLLESVRDKLPNVMREKISRFGRFFAPVPAPRPASLLDELVFPSIEGSLRCLKAHGFQPEFAVDVGAYHGEWTLLFKEVFPESAVLMVEAQEKKRKRLEEICGRFAGSVTMRIALLGASSGQQIRFVEMETGSSVYEERSEYPRKVTEKQTESLDELLSVSARVVDFLKLDVQGYELQVLRGGPKSLEQAQCVLLEASLVPINQGCPSYAEVTEFMSRSGFRLFDFCSQIRRKDGVLWQTDLLFVRTSAKLVLDERLTYENWG